MNQFFCIFAASYSVFVKQYLIRIGLVAFLLCATFLDSADGITSNSTTDGCNVSSKSAATCLPMPFAPRRHRPAWPLPDLRACYLLMVVNPRTIQADGIMKIRLTPYYTLPCSRALAVIGSVRL